MNALAADLLATLLSSANLRAFLSVVRAGEGTSDPDGYRRHFGGKLFDSFAGHPRMAITAGGYTSTAAGAYQFLARTWDECAAALGLADFSPASQDAAAVYLIRRRGALDDAVAGRLEAAIAKCAKEWASLPGSPYGQPTRTLAQATKTYLDAGGVIASAQPQKQEAPVDPITGTFIGAAFDALLKHLPGLFGSKEERKDTMIRAAVDVAKGAVEARNEQELIEKLETDPQATATVRKAIEDNWFTITEAGGGGIAGARKNDIAFVKSGEPVWRSPSFVVAMALLPMAYMIVANVVGILGTALPPDVRSAISNGVIGMVLGGLIGYYYGQTTSRNRTPA